MRFFPHGHISPEATAALLRHGHTLCTPEQLTGNTPAPDSPDAPALPDNPHELLPLLHARQCHLLTTDTALVRQIYDDKIEFPNGLIVHLLEDPAVNAAQPAAIDRLFARYPRLTPKRLYTLTASRVKIRQLPGPH